MERTKSLDWTYIQELISLRRGYEGFQYLAFVIDCAPQVARFAICRSAFAIKPPTSVGKGFSGERHSCRVATLYGYHLSDVRI